MAGSTISTTITNQVTLGYGVALNALTITNAGDIDNSGGYGVLVATAYDGTILNQGSIIGRTDGVYAAGYAVTILNQGTIYGDQVGLLLNSFIDGPNLIINSALISGNAGIEGGGVNLVNDGSIGGQDFGIRLNFSTIVNAGMITGQIGIEAQQDVVSNTGNIHGRQTGLYVAGGSAINLGSISGGVGAQITNDAGDGSLTNQGAISGGVIVAGGTLTNTGQINGVTGVALGVGGNAVNSGSIYGQAYGVSIRERADGDSFVNSGTIYGKNDGVLISSGYFANSGSIAGGNAGIAISGGFAANSGRVSSNNLGVALSGVSFANSGTIYGQTDGVAIAGGTITNFETITGNVAGAIQAGGSVVNYGVISGAAYGVADVGGNLSNDGLISSASQGVTVSHGMLTNAGTIAGRDAVYGSFITLNVDPGAVFDGAVVNNSNEGLLDLQGAGLGSLGGVGSQIMGFNEISFSSGANWVVEGDISGLAAGETIAGMARVDTIVLDGFTAALDSFVGGSGLELSNGFLTVTLDIQGSFSTGGFSVTDADGNTVIRDVTCYVAGTRIATPGGDVAVEMLKIGDLVRTLHAGDRPIKWVGWRRYEGAAIAGNRAALPVCIRQDAIADRVPNRDLWVSPGHAIAIDNVLVHANRLVNGVSVVQAQNVDTVTYYHVELCTHEVIFAENCPAESFHDEHFRRQFANARDYRRLYPGEAAAGVMCLPRLDSGFQLHAIARRVALRAGIADVTTTGALLGYVDQCGGGKCFGWAQDMAAPETPVSLDIRCDNRLVGRVLANLYREDVRASGVGSGYHGFELMLPAGLTGEIEVLRTVDGARLEMAGVIRRAA